jgi:L-ascorbate metabolism protein UlaG (beta-lactamase superfamily)
VGLRRDFPHTIYCSPVSARLLAHDWRLRAPQVQELPLGQPLVLQGVTVTAIDANHCPGAVMLLFEVPTLDGSVNRILHTGDCRWAAVAAATAINLLQDSELVSRQTL